MQATRKYCIELRIYSSLLGNLKQKKNKHTNVLRLNGARTI